MRHWQPPHEFVPNLAPMVDVIMVLLVFFLLGASLDLVTQGVLQTELDPRSGPGAGAGVTIIPQVTITLEKAEDDGALIRVMGEILPDNSAGGLRAYLAARRAAGADPDNVVVIGAASAVRWRHVIAAMDAAVQAGFRNIQFAVSFERP
jgi:biopolymer transport protein ExbD